MPTPRQACGKAAVGRASTPLAAVADSVGDLTQPAPMMARAERAAAVRTRLGGTCSRDKRP